MKRAITATLFLSAMLNFNYCIGQEKIQKAEAPDCISYFMLQADGEELINNYKNVFIKELAINNLSSNIWVDGKIISVLARIFSTAGNGYDGVKLLNGIGSDGMSTVALVPTKLNGKIHEEQYKEILKLDKKDLEFQNFDLTIQQVGKMVRGFGELCRKDKVPGDFCRGAKIDYLSASIWLPACVFVELGKIIDNPPAGMKAADGISVSFGAYEDMDTYPIPSQVYYIQSTAILVPTQKSGAFGHVLYWDIYESLYEKSMKDFDPKKIRTAYNHGELCPNACNCDKAAKKTK